MASKNILDYQGNVIGQLDLPDETSEEIWAEKLSLYARPPMTTPVVVRVMSYIGDAQKFAMSMANQFAAENSMLGIKQANKTGAVMNYLHEMVHCIISGSLNEAVIVVDRYIADDSQEKADLAPFITNARLTQYKNIMQDWLGIPKT